MAGDFRAIEKDPEISHSVGTKVRGHPADVGVMKPTKLPENRIAHQLSPNWVRYRVDDVPTEYKKVRSQDSRPDSQNSTCQLDPYRAGIAVYTTRIEQLSAAVRAR